MIGCRYTACTVPLQWEQVRNWKNICISARKYLVHTDHTCSGAVGEAARSPSFSRCGRAVEASAVEAAAGTLGGGRYYCDVML